MNGATANRPDALRVYAWLLLCVVAAGEAATLALTDKYWPQGMDEFAFAACMATLCARPLDTQRLTLMLAGWAFLFGSLYTMLFSRLDPHGGTHERIPGLLVLMAACAVGAVWTLGRLGASRQS